MKKDYLEGSAWDTWHKAGVDYARKCREQKLHNTSLDEKAFNYAVSRNLPHLDVIKEAFLKGYWSETKMKAVILDGHTLGVVIGSDIQVLRASVLRGASYVPAIGMIPMPIDSSRIRLATRQDFEDFGVVPHDDYFNG